MHLLAIAPLTMAIFGLNVALFLVCASRSSSLGPIQRDVLLNMGASWREGLWEGEWLRLIAPIFLHGGLAHIFFNSLTLYYVGPNAERLFGSANFGTVYLLSGVAGFCFSQMFGGGLSVGASCSLFGIMGAALVVRILDCPVPKYAWRNPQVRSLFYFLVFFLAIGFAGLMGNVDNWGHLGGLLVGALVGGWFDLWRRRRHISYASGIAVLLLCAALVCAARWSFYSPYYHLHQAVIAEEDRRPADAVREFQEARRWAKVWRSEEKISRLIAAYKAGEWQAKDARQYGYKSLLPQLVIRHYGG